MDPWLEQVVLFLVALVANCLSAIAGGGAGLLQLPVIIFMGLPFAVALATHKVASVALGVGASVRHYKSSQLHPKISLLIVLAGVPGVILGANTILLISENMAKMALGILTIGLGLYSMLKKEFGSETELTHLDHKGLATGALAICFFGFLNGSLTSGTGLFVTLWLIRWFGFDYKLAVAHTLIFVGLFWNSTGAVTLGLQQSIQWSWVPALVLGSLAGGYLGAHLSIIKGNTLIKRVFEITTLAVGIRLLIN